MKTQYGFIEFETLDEFKTWLSRQTIKRKITKLQIHHTAAPSYSNWSTDIALRRQNNMKSFHINDRGMSDIAQHFTIFPDGHIVTGRSLEKDPAGITGFNTNAICCEIYGNFDKGGDTMNAVQREAVIAFYGLLCEKFKITPSSSTIRYHAWYDAKGNYLGNYIQGKSTKTCPGTNFFGGNTITAFNNNFLPEIKKFITQGIVSTQPPTQTTNYQIIVTTDLLNVRSGAGTNYKKMGCVKKGEVFTIVEVKNDWGRLKSGAGWISLAYTEIYNPINSSTNTYQVKVIADMLNVRSGPSVDYEEVTTIKKGEIFTIVEVKNDWGKLASGAGWISLKYTETYLTGK